MPFITQHFQLTTYVFDLDGVLYRMDEPIPGAVEAVARLQQSGKQVFFLTNNSSKTRQDYVQKLARIGITTPVDSVMTSAYALGQLLIQWGDVGKTVYVIGESGLKSELESVGMRIAEYADGEQIDIVVAGWDRQFTYGKLSEAHLSIGRGARFIATNRDATYPDAAGRTLPGSGALVAALATCSGVEPVVIGKPERHTLDLILRQSNATPEQCLVVGDRIDTDIAIGKAAGTLTALVLTGVHTEADLARFPQFRADFVWPDLAPLG